MNGSVLAFRPAWWLVFWGLLTSLSVNWVLPVFDHHAAEYSPFHDHAVVGDVAQRQHLLETHTHGAGQPHTHSSAGTPITPAETIISVSLLDGLLTLVTRASEIMAAPVWALPQPPLALWLVAGAAALLYLGRTAPPPERPPRFL